MDTKSTTMKLCTFMGALAGTLMFVGIWPLARMFPPLDPALPVAQVADYYRAHQTGILVGGSSSPLRRCCSSPSSPPSQRSSRRSKARSRRSPGPS
ncbi:hypothetical protein ACFSLT_31290 [Novosphingobium resinovorum]